MTITVVLMTSDRLPLQFNRFAEKHEGIERTNRVEKSDGIVRAMEEAHSTAHTYTKPINEREIDQNDSNASRKLSSQFPIWDLSIVAVSKLLSTATQKQQSQVPAHRARGSETENHNTKRN